ncbi:hypothetical protein [Bacillus sp. CGMCC 1.16541]|uniref:hypothetical protein n=1 Tax=Bacillus sp. CGMCC 1.16541 TaxID=2185143 RepID=UPI000D73F3E1|nr:hypothetical protein [Bacillus sp. CGMCC 1.16541]
MVNASISTFSAGGDTGVTGSGSVVAERADETSKIYYRFQLYRNGTLKKQSSGEAVNQSRSASLTDYEYLTGGAN